MPEQKCRETRYMNSRMKGMQITQQIEAKLIKNMYPKTNYLDLGVQVNSQQRQPFVPALF